MKICRAWWIWRKKLWICIILCPRGKKARACRSPSAYPGFVPKPFTPFQYEPQDTREQLQEKQQFLLHAIKSKKIRLNYHDVSTSFLEACFAKGDRRLAKVLYRAFQKGCKFDGWDDQFRYDLWLEALQMRHRPTFYANRRIPFGEIHPWSHLDYMISEEFLQSENQKAYQSLTTPNCKLKCSNCGAASEKRGVCVAKR